jgi:hypothetical protein
LPITLGWSGKLSDEVCLSLAPPGAGGRYRSKDERSPVRSVGAARPEVKLLISCYNLAALDLIVHANLDDSLSLLII